MKQKKFNNNEVEEIARMQRVIDTYHAAFMALYRKAFSKEDVIAPIFESSNLSNKWYKIICEQIEKGNRFDKLFGGKYMPNGTIHNAAVQYLETYNDDADILKAFIAGSQYVIEQLQNVETDLDGDTFVAMIDKLKELKG